ncbi:hypothetical protein I5907_12535 [Panacibacter sp. DH6]|uniref:PA14 domain-containing protein n=1 Tax=Panacibacter microcysteis TaxID=2793269 RepID=A0A931E8H5_9BACT|nr:PA14 domain-containing protein [Panacibacter microcysteis]MBG9377063.1 hypothetical protein [Panacibacter microcysteis]
MLLTLYAVFICCSSFNRQTSKQAITAPQTNGVTTFSFVLNENRLTSAGVFNTEGKLIRTLWSGVMYNAGKQSASWDGTDDQGRLVKQNSYVVKVLSGNMQYKWQGVIGNTSDSFTGSTVHHAMRRMYGMSIVKNTAFYTTYYNEKASSTFKFNTSEPQKKSAIYNEGISVQFVAADEERVYWAGTDTAQNFIYATNVADDNPVLFSTGKNKLLKAKEAINIIDATSKSAATISGIAVQHKANYLFVAYDKLNELHVLDKRTGRLVKKIPVNKPRAVTVDRQDNVWIIYDKQENTIVGKFDIENGLSRPIIRLTNLQQPLAIAVSPDNKMVLVADGGNSQQLKAYDNSGGEFLWSYGKAGGYATDPTVSDDKFFFREDRTGPATFIAFEKDGSFWVEDSGNDRVQHFSASRKWIDRIMYRSISYSMFVDHNQPSRVFSDYLEFSIDYTKPLSANNGSWTLVRNWGYNVPAEWDDKYNRLRCVNTLKNGRTYALQHRIANNNSKGKWVLVELPGKGQLRFTNIEIPDNTQLYPDGSLRRVSKLVPGRPTTWTQRTLKDFDDSDNPVWNEETVLASSPAATKYDPLFWGNINKLKAGEITSSNLVISFDGGLTPNGSDGYHLGAIKVNGNEWLWRTANSTTKAYKGVYPGDGSYDNGNNVKYAGSVALVNDRNIFWGYHGEFWKNSQVNKWTHVYDDGLFVGQFGVTGKEVENLEAPAGMAGNAFAAALVEDKEGNLYLYHNDESYHSGIHRWHISGFNTITEQTIPIQLPAVQNGLTAVYFSGRDLNNTKMISSGIDANVASDLSSYTGKEKQGHKNFSVRWQGFIEPLYTDDYFVSAKSTGSTRIWIDDSLLQHNKPLHLEAGVRYPFKLEYADAYSDNAQLRLLWRTAKQQESAIPAARFFTTVNTAKPVVYDLLEGLPHNSSLEANRYGWKKYPEQDDLTDKYSKWWSVSTNIKKYTKDESPDLYIRFRKQSDTAVVVRDIGSFKTDNWKIYGTIDFEGNYLNTASPGKRNSGGSFIEVLDDEQKVIARFFAEEALTTRQAFIQANDKKILQIPGNVMKSVTGKQQPFAISANQGTVTISYGDDVVTTIPFDSEANWQRPSAIRIYFWSGGSNYDRVTDIYRLFYQPR